MNNQLQIFEHEKFGKIRSLLIDGEPWFVAADACRVLELKNPSDILKRLDDDEKQKISESRVVVDPILNIGSEKREVNIVNEPGLYRLIFSSRKPEAREFQRWVYHEVLPAIRKTGSYTMPSAKTTPKPVKKIRRPLSLKAYVYILLMSNGTVKIGHSDNVNNRISSIKSKYKLTVKDSYQTQPLAREIARLTEKACHEIFSSSKVDGEFFNVDFAMAHKIVDTLVKQPLSHEIARLIEKACHEIFSSSKVDGEFFNVYFETACKVVDTLVKFANTLPLLSNFERGEKLLTIAREMKELSENQTAERTLLMEASEVFARKNIS